MGLDPASWAIIITSIATTAAGSAVSYNQSQQAAKQTEYNNKAAADAVAMEQRRKAAELAENQKRQALQSKRERAAQLADLVGTGFMTSSGTALALSGNTIEAQSRAGADLTTQGDLEGWQLGTQGQSILAEGRSQASLMRGQATSSLVSGLVSAASSGAGMYMNSPRTYTPGVSMSSTYRNTRGVSARPTGI